MDYKEKLDNGLTVVNMVGKVFESDVKYDFESEGYEPTMNGHENHQNKTDILTNDFRIQCKCTAQALDYKKILKEMPGDRIKVIAYKHMHKMSETDYDVRGKYAILEYEDFIKLMQVYARRTKLQ
jgi:hypothetical protein